MKPNKIIILRHGESCGNADKTLYSRIPDHEIDLTPKGVEQAIEAGRQLKQIIGDQKVQVYCSPYRRTRETARYALTSFDSANILYREDPRIREVEWSACLQIEKKLEEKIDKKKEARDYGLFYYRFDRGESCADAYDGRVSTFLDTLHRDFEKEQFPETALIVSHGMLMRVFLMRFFHWTVEEFHNLRNPLNCQYFILERIPGTNKYSFKNRDEMRVRA